MNAANKRRSKKKPYSENSLCGPLKQPLRKKIALMPFLLTFGIMLGFWLIFSGRFDGFHITLGVISSTGVSLVSSRLLFPDGLSPHLLQCWLKFALYLPWLFKQILLANLHLLYLTFHPNMKTLINPKVIKFNSRLKSDVSRTTFANSITLTPGTITIYAGVMGSFAVHCIDDPSGKELPGKMEEKILRVFDE